MLVLLPDLLTARIVVILAQIEAVYAARRLKNEGVGQRSGGRIVIALEDKRPAAHRLKLNPELQRWRMVFILSPGDVILNALRFVRQDGREFLIG